MIYLLKKYVLSIMVVIIIIILCFMNTKPLPAPPIKNFDKAVHLIMFLTLSGVVFFDNTRYLRYRISKLRIFLGSFLFPVLFGGLIEILQSYLTRYRKGDWFDFLGDTAGIALAAGIAWLINRFYLSKKRKEVFIISSK